MQEGPRKGGDDVKVQEGGEREGEVVRGEESVQSSAQ
jgi:hypothetical protein